MFILRHDSQFYYELPLCYFVMYDTLRYVTSLQLSRACLPCVIHGRNFRRLQVMNSASFSDSVPYSLLLDYECKTSSDE